MQEAFAISSLLRHKRITVPLTQTTTTWDPVQHWNFPTDKNRLTVQSYKLTGSLGRAVSVIPSMNEPLLSSTCHVFIGTNEAQCLCKSSPLLYHLYQIWLSIEYLLCPEKFLSCYWCLSCTGFHVCLSCLSFKVSAYCMTLYPNTCGGGWSRFKFRDTLRL